MAHTFGSGSLLIIVVIIVAAVFRHLCVAQDKCGQISNVSNETAGTPPVDILDNRREVFYFDMNNPASCSGRIASWKLCYHGPTDAEDQVIFAIYRLVDNGTRYNQMSDTFCATLNDNSNNEVSRSRRSTSKTKPSGTRSLGGSRSKSRSKSVNSRSCTSIPLLMAQSLHRGFYCYEALEDDSSINIEAGDVIGACVTDNSMDSVQERVDIVGVVNTSEHSLFYNMNINECSTKQFPLNISFSQLSRLNSTRLHFYLDISK